jgi:hypothetical protein
MARRAGRLGNGRAQEHPATFAPPLRQAGIAQDLHMARHTRLALPEHLRQFAHGQLHAGQKPHDTQTGGVCQGAQGSSRVIVDAI